MQIFSHSLSILDADDTFNGRRWYTFRKPSPPTSARMSALALAGLALTNLIDEETKKELTEFFKRTNYSIFVDSKNAPEPFRWISSYLGSLGEFIPEARSVAVHASGDFHSPGTNLIPNMSLVHGVPGHGTQSFTYNGVKVTFQRYSSFGGSDASDTEAIAMRVPFAQKAILHEILQDAEQRYLKRKVQNMTVYLSDPFHAGVWEPVAERPRHDIRQYILSTAAHEVLQECVAFKDEREEYLARGVPYRRGYLLYGPPGNGKSSFVQLVANAMCADVYYVQLVGVEDREFLKLLASIPPGQVICIEDVDCAFVGRTANPGQGVNVTMQGLLNGIDGVIAQEGSILFMTSNHPSRLDPALTRPGRTDRHIEFSPPLRGDVETMIRMFFGREVSNSNVNEFNAWVSDICNIFQVCIAALRSMSLPPMGMADVKGTVHRAYSKYKTARSRCTFSDSLRQISRGLVWSVLSALINKGCDMRESMSTEAVDTRRTQWWELRECIREAFDHDLHSWARDAKFVECLLQRASQTMFPEEQERSTKYLLRLALFLCVGSTILRRQLPYDEEKLRQIERTAMVDSVSNALCDKHAFRCLALHIYSDDVQGDSFYEHVADSLTYEV